ncbi:carboxylating nicotinate-nucleotide diphosphorylase [soil metagenome]
MTLPTILFDDIIDRALREDLSSGDVTTESTVAEGTTAEAHAVARSEIVVCGGAVFARVFAKLDPASEVTLRVADGTLSQKGTKLWRVRGDARAILMAERTALNLTQRMCGIATTTKTYVDALPPSSKTRITDTRKTMPGLRVLDRYAVRVGGAKNHRNDLGSAVLIKDNHVVAAGGVRAAIERARARAPHTSKIECEVDSLEQLTVALDAGADIVLLDNMTTDVVARAVAQTSGRAFLEASGGITLARVRELADAGVDAISVGALTHSVVAADIGLDFTT